jgi:hypothetical protein
VLDLLWLRCRRRLRGLSHASGRRARRRGRGDAHDRWNLRTCRSGVVQMGVLQPGPSTRRGQDHPSGARWANLAEVSAASDAGRLGSWDQRPVPLSGCWMAPAS